jgi:glycosyltransferase involved in cell wall biosynthesis
MPQSYSLPADLYRRLDEAGMTHKTITDHHRIDGALEIAHFPDVFLSEKVTTYFPDGCKIHLLAWKITEAQHRAIQEARPDIFQLSAYLRSERISHAVTHPLVSLNGQFSADHFEKLVLLFRCFECVNGNTEPLHQEVAAMCLAALTPETIDRLADRHGITPSHAHAHRKVLVGGSDDHSGLYAARAYTQCESAATLDDFFAALELGGAEAMGQRGDPLSLSSGIYTTVFKFATARLTGTAPLGATLLGKMAERFLAGQNPTHFSFGERLGHIAESVRTGQAFDFVRPGETTLAYEIGRFFSEAKVRAALDAIISEETDVRRRSFRMASYLSNQLAFRLATQFQQRLNRQNLLDAFQSLSGLLPVGSSVLPYLVAFHQQAPDRPLLRSIASSFLPAVPAALENTKRAWFTDTLEDVNGVARTIHTMARAAYRAGAELTVVTCRHATTVADIPIRNFAPVGEFEIPEYELQKLSWPPFLEMVDYVQRKGFTELIISTPGPVGLCAVAAGKLLGLRMSGIYHTDFPQYARFLSDDAFMETLTWSYMQWFYGQMDIIYSNSDFYLRRWMERGISQEKLRILPRGLDTELFNPAHRDPEFWAKRGAKRDLPVLLYVGRISKEKELAFLAEVATALRQRGIEFTLALVGEGPYRDELAALVPEAIFTGVLRGEELGAAYASADLFVFPSTTDTFGNVVIEAMASGLSAMVSDMGGPKELVRTPLEGAVLPARNLDAWQDTLATRLADLPSRDQRLALARQIHEERSWDRAFKQFWEG